MKQIEMMIKVGVQEEVNAALKPLQDRLGEQEKTVEDLTMQLSSIMKELSSLKSNAVGSQGEYPDLQQLSLHPEQQTVNQGPGVILLGGDGEVGAHVGVSQRDRLQQVKMFVQLPEE